jgi:pimeloyl-ACP methyl ester carboxylesterase
MTHAHATAPTQFVEANGIRFAYRRFGKAGVPLLFMQHFRGGMDNWDPAVTDGFASGRPVILFNNAGVASSSGETPDTVETMADYAADFVNALRLSQVDVLGFSIGGYVAQALTLRHPEFVRRLVLVGTGPRAGEPTQDPNVLEHARTDEPVLENFLYLFFSPSASSQAAGRAFWERRHLRKNDVDPPSSPQTMAAQIAALTEWRQARGERFAELKAIAQPTLVVNGNNDIMVPTINSFTLSHNTFRTRCSSSIRTPGTARTSNIRICSCNTRGSSSMAEAAEDAVAATPPRPGPACGEGRRGSGRRRRCPSAPR